MNNDQENKLSMYLAVRDFLNGENSIWNGLVAFVSAFATFVAGITAIEEEGSEQVEPITGYARDKKELETELIDIALKVSKAVFAYAEVEGDAALQDKMDFSRSSLEQVKRYGDCQFVPDDI